MLVSKFTVYQENLNINSADKLRRRAQNRKKADAEDNKQNAEEPFIDVKKNLWSPTHKNIRP
jgi:hypothetical protein